MASSWGQLCSCLDQCPATLHLLCPLVHCPGQARPCGESEGDGEEPRALPGAWPGAGAGSGTAGDLITRGAAHGQQRPPDEQELEASVCSEHAPALASSSCTGRTPGGCDLGPPGSSQNRPEGTGREVSVHWGKQDAARPPEARSCPLRGRSLGESSVLPALGREGCRLGLGWLPLTVPPVGAPPAPRPWLTTPHWVLSLRRAQEPTWTDAACFPTARPPWRRGAHLTEEEDPVGG